MVTLFTITCSSTTPTIQPTGAVDSATTYSYSGSYQTVVVPFGAASMTVTAYGAGGGTVTCSGKTCTSGRGAQVTATFSVNVGDTYYVYIGGQGGISTGANAVGGYNGGGVGCPLTTCTCSGGSGATDVRTIQGTDTTALNSRIIVAGGGGGCNSYISDGGAGGLNGYRGSGNGGYGGSQTSGGAAGASDGSSGSFGQGGFGGTSFGGGGGGGIVQ